MKTVHSVALATLLSAVACMPAWAHHEIGGYDLAHPMIVNGVVREFVWANPHVMLYMEVPGANSRNVVWALEGAAVPVLTHDGWTRESLRPGDRVAVLLAPRQDDPHRGRILRVTQSNGRVLSISQPSYSAR
jgi:hypothetical protein